LGNPLAGSYGSSSFSFQASSSSPLHAGSQASSSSPLRSVKTRNRANTVDELRINIASSNDSSTSIRWRKAKPEKKKTPMVQSFSFPVCSLNATPVETVTRHSRSNSQHSLEVLGTSSRESSTESIPNPVEIKLQTLLGVLANLQKSKDKYLILEADGQYKLKKERPDLVKRQAALQVILKTIEELSTERLTEKLLLESNSLYFLGDSQQFILSLFHLLEAFFQTEQFKSVLRKSKETPLFDLYKSMILKTCIDKTVSDGLKHVLEKTYASLYKLFGIFGFDWVVSLDTGSMLLRKKLIPYPLMPDELDECYVRLLDKTQDFETQFISGLDELLKGSWIKNRKSILEKASDITGLLVQPNKGLELIFSSLVEEFSKIFTRLKLITRKEAQQIQTDFKLAWPGGSKPTNYDKVIEIINFVLAKMKGYEKVLCLIDHFYKLEISLNEYNTAIDFEEHWVVVSYLLLDVNEKKYIQMYLNFLKRQAEIHFAKTKDGKKRSVREKANAQKKAKNFDKLVTLINTKLDLKI
jgi:hypothetical protein